MFFKKRHIMYAIILVVSAKYYVAIAKLGIFPILIEFGVPSSLWFLPWFIRGVYKEYIIQGAE